ncbi:MAG: class I SAM-dependent methyltransferase [Chromatiales bacterium]|jgi:2-polyprenyl-3-methyl-5-hydroxy-6-metoxy-1,4-benzoquinol methylase|nr:class I SAM-dependent methyltransferase [Chromatiales bacterium]
MELSIASTGDQLIDEIATSLISGLERAPDDSLLWQRMGLLLASTSSLEFSPTLRPWMLRALQHPHLYPPDIAGSIASMLCRAPLIAALSTQAMQGCFPAGRTLGDVLAQLADDKLLLALMVTTVVPNAPLEQVFTALRRALLLGGEDALAMIDERVLSLIVALAIQAFIVEYVWYVTDEEEQALVALTTRVEEALRCDDINDPCVLCWLAIVAAYRPLLELDHAESLVAGRWSLPVAFAELIRFQIVEPLEERVLRRRIPRLTQIHDQISQKVRQQYEEHPYPRWIRADRAPQSISLLAYMEIIGAEAPRSVSFAKPDVLVAGCGSGMQSIFAATFYRDAKVLALDLSLASLAYAKRKTAELKLTRIEYAQADIMELRKLKRCFHVIESIGVLHHLADPVAGWKILKSMLRSGGIMRIALYSETARQGVVMARDHIAARNYQPVPADIRRCRLELLEYPQDHPVSILRNTARDFYSMSDCRDLIFHVNEHRFTLPQLQQVLHELGLRFLCFNQFNPVYLELYRRRFPDDPAMRSLDNWHLFELEYPDTFIGTYDFWCQKA